jgi:hypothetical protein
VHGANNYELATPVLNLARIRRNVTHAQQTHAHIRRLATQMGLALSATDTLSVSHIANRLMSLRLDPDNHPLPDDRILRLILLGVRAALGRFDVSPAMRGLYAAWFVAMGLAPREQSAWLARQMTFPQIRGNVNQLLSVMERWPADGAAHS